MNTCMRSFFWIGCILAVLLTAGLSGVSAETNETTAVQAVIPADNETVNVSVPVNETGDAVTMDALQPVDQGIEPATEVAESGTMTEAVIVAEEPAAEEPDLINETLVTFVKDAKNFALISGKNNAITAFNDRNAEWASPEMAIFAYDNDGKVLAFPLNLNVVGLNQLSVADPNGLRYIEQMRNAAKSGGNFVRYMAADTADGMIVKEKTAYILPVDGTWWIGASVFTPVVETTEEAVVIESDNTGTAPVESEAVENSAAA